MQDYIYSVIPIVAMAIHLIINFDLRSEREQITAHGTREYRAFLKGIFLYYIADAGWGIFAGLRWTPILYLDTVFYYITISVSVLAWCRFVIAYLSIEGWPKQLLEWFGYSLLTLYVSMLTVNLFTGCLFQFDVNGHYCAGPLRGYLFYPLVALNALMGIFVLARAHSCLGGERRRNLLSFVFCLTMGAAIVFQVQWPLWPYYALGCLLGNCFLHIYVIEDERDELRQAVLAREQTAMHMAELKDALERARSAEKARSTFFSIVSHDIRTPLNAILGYAELLHDIADPAERERALDSIRASGTTLLQLVNDVLDLAKMDSGKMTLHPEPVSLARLTDEVFASFRLAAAEKEIELVNRTSEVPTVLLDEHRFRQILYNLVGNAVKFTDRGSVTVAATYAEGQLEVAVGDTGCGIPAKMLAKIMDPFVQVRDPSHSADREGGSGLGLSICRRLVEVMGGKLIVESELGMGSTFRARIPGVAAVEDRTGSAASRPAAPAKLPGHVLVVDDSAVNRSVLTAFLRKAGVSAIESAGDGVEALAKLEAAAQAGQPYDFILSDLWMPNMNGPEFIEKLRGDGRFRHLPVFAVTADTEARRDPRTALFTGILLKPMTYAKLVECFAALENGGMPECGV